MGKVKVISNQAGVCPYCNSEDIEYGVAKFEPNFIYYPCTCGQCKRYFEEWNELSFSGNNVGSSGEYEASDCLDKEIEYEDDDEIIVNQHLQFTHINDCWKQLREAKSLEEVENLLKNFPSWSGNWWVESEYGQVIIFNDWYDKTCETWKLDREVLDIPYTKED